MALTPDLTIYDFDQVTCVFGPIIMDGFQDGEGITIEQEPTFTDKKGLDGKVTRSKTLDRRATITINLMQVSAANDLLSALHALDRDAPNGAGIVPITIRDRNGRAVFSAAQAWISQAPQVTFDQEATVRAWVIRCAKLNRVDGGN